MLWREGVERLFDRSLHEPDPVGVYFSILELGDACVVARGNHDEWLASYLWDYCRRTERERAARVSVFGDEGGILCVRE